MKKFLAIILSVMMIFSLALVGCGEDEDPSAGKLVFKASDDGSYYSVSISANYKDLETITVPSAYDGVPVKAVSTRGFAGMKNLTSITLPSSITEIKTNAFLGCTALESVVASGVTKLGKSAFGGCSKLTSVELGAITEIADECFKGCTSLTIFAVPSGVTAIGKYAFSGCTKLNNITLPTSLTEIDNYAFEKCASLTQVAFPTEKSLRIGDYAFTYSGLTSVKIPANVTLGTYTFDHLAWDDQEQVSKCTAVYFYNEAPTSATLGVNSIGYTWDAPDFRVFVPNGTIDAYTQICQDMSDDAWRRCVLADNKMLEFNPTENPYA